MKVMFFVGVVVSVVVVLIFGFLVQVVLGDILKVVKDWGVLNCFGYNGLYFGFVEVDDKGVWKGLDIDLCCVLVMVIFDDFDKIKVVLIFWMQCWFVL